MLEERLESARARRQLYLAAAATILSFAIADVLLASSTSAALAIRSVWAGVYVVAAVAAGRLPGWAATTAGYVSGPVNAASLLALIELTGGAGSPYLFGLAIIPLLVALTGPRTVTPILSNAVACTAALAWIVLGAGAGTIAALGLGTVAASAWAVWGFCRLRASRQAAREAAGLAAASRLASAVAHEINNPLAAAMADVEYLQGLLAPGDQARDVSTETLGALERIRLVVGDLRALVEDEGHPRGSASPGDAIGDAIRLASYRLVPGLEVIADVPGFLPPVAGSRARLVQILVHLLTNAADALEGRKGGRIRVSAEARDGSVRIAVEDNGPGVAPDRRKRLFRPFATTKPPGTGVGLGLVLSRGFAEQLGGSLRYEDRPGGGARFVLELPFDAGGGSDTAPAPGRRRR